jgi:hypothetical protein
LQAIEKSWLFRTKRQILHEKDDYPLKNDPAMQAALAADIGRLTPKLLTGGELDAARRRERLVLLPAGFA